MTEIWERDAWELANSVRGGEISAVELLDVFRERVDRLDPELNAFCFLDFDGAGSRASEIDAEIAAGENPGPWAGVPMGVKELAQVAGFPDTHASLLYRDEIAAADGTEAARLRAAGAVLVGLTTSPEFGSTNWTRSFLHGVTRNPWDPERTPGGSSGGSAAAVAAGLMPICTGSDGGGSIRIPSAYSGLFGFKVSFGRVGSAGPFDNSLTSVPGPICRSVRDAARYVDAIAGPTVTDPTSLPLPARPYEDALLSGDAVAALRGKRVAWSSTLGFAVCDPEVEKRAHEARVRLDCRRRPAARRPRRPHSEAIAGVGHPLVDRRATHHAEAAEGRLDDITPVPRAGFESTSRLTAEQLLTALRRRDEMLAAIGRVFDEVDLLLTPTVATTAFVAEGPPPMEIDGQRVGGMGSVPYTAPFNISGQPAVEHSRRAGARRAPDRTPGRRATSRRGVGPGLRPRRRSEQSLAEVRPARIPLNCRHARIARAGGQVPFARDRRAPGRSATLAQAGAGAGLRNRRRGRTRRAADAAAHLDARARSRQHVRPRRRPWSRRRGPGSSGPAILEGAEGADEVGRLPREGHPHRHRHALTSRSLRGRRPHRA